MTTTTTRSFSPFVASACSSSSSRLNRRKHHHSEATKNRRRRHDVLVASSSSSPLFKDENNFDENEERIMNETIAGTKTSRVVDFVAAWDLLSGRLSESSIMRSEDRSDDIASSRSPSGNAPSGFSVGDTEVTTDAFVSFG